MYHHYSTAIEAGSDQLQSLATMAPPKAGARKTGLYLAIFLATETLHKSTPRTSYERYALAAAQS